MFLSSSSREGLLVMPLSQVHTARVLHESPAHASFPGWDHTKGSGASAWGSQEYDIVEDCPEIVESDPIGRYVRYDRLLGRGATKTVYEAFDQVLGLEVAWNQIEMKAAHLDPELKNHIYEEVHVLKHLKHKNIMAFHYGWFDKEKQNLNFITEMFSHGTLRQYRKKLRAPLRETCLKRWAWQILEGLVYLHGHNPPIIHRDLKCDNIFVNGTTGQVKIGDLGLATCNRGLSVVGTPEFMAPEIYDEHYDEKVDIWAFGMCMLELAVLEYPYSECRGIPQIYRKVSQGIKPAGLDKVSNPELRAFIECCLEFDPTQRPSARELLRHPFLRDLRAQANASYQLPPQIAMAAPSSTGSLAGIRDPPSDETISSTPTDMEVEGRAVAHPSSMGSDWSTSEVLAHAPDAGGLGHAAESPLGCECTPMPMLDTKTTVHRRRSVASHMLDEELDEMDDSDEEVLMPLATLKNTQVAGLSAAGAIQQSASSDSTASAQQQAVEELLEALDHPGPKVLVRRRMWDESFSKVNLEGMGNDMLRRGGTTARAAWLRRSSTARGDELLNSVHLGSFRHSRHHSDMDAIPDVADASEGEEAGAAGAFVGSAPIIHTRSFLLSSASLPYMLPQMRLGSDAAGSSLLTPVPSSILDGGHAPFGHRPASNLGVVQSGETEADQLQNGGGVGEPQPLHHVSLALQGFAADRLPEGRRQQRYTTS